MNKHHEAIADYVARQQKMIDGIERGLDDMRTGRVTPHDEAMRRIRTTIDKARKTS